MKLKNKVNQENDKKQKNRNKKNGDQIWQLKKIKGCNWKTILIL
jgi:uncharacterized protein (DUF2249 family)